MAFLFFSIALVLTLAAAFLLFLDHRERAARRGMKRNVSPPTTTVSEEAGPEHAAKAGPSIISSSERGTASRAGGDPLPLALSNSVGNEDINKAMRTGLASDGPNDRTVLPSASDPRPAPFQKGHAGTGPAGTALGETKVTAPEVTKVTAPEVAVQTTSLKAMQSKSSLSRPSAGGSSLTQEPNLDASSDDRTNSRLGKISVPLAASLSKGKEKIQSVRKASKKSREARFGKKADREPLLAELQWGRDRSFASAAVDELDGIAKGFAGIDAATQLSADALIGFYRGYRVAIVPARSGKSTAVTLVVLHRQVGSHVRIELAPQGSPFTKETVREMSVIAGVSIGSDSPGEAQMIVDDRLDRLVKRLPSGLESVVAHDEWSTVTLTGQLNTEVWDDAVGAVSRLADIARVLPEKPGAEQPINFADADPGGPGAVAGPTMEDRGHSAASQLPAQNAPVISASSERSGTQTSPYQPLVAPAMRRREGATRLPSTVVPDVGENATAGNGAQQWAAANKQTPPTQTPPTQTPPTPAPRRATEAAAASSGGESSSDTQEGSTTEPSTGTTVPAGPVPASAGGVARRRRGHLRVVEGEQATVETVASHEKLDELPSTGVDVSGHAHSVEADPETNPAEATSALVEESSGDTKPEGEVEKDVFDSVLHPSDPAPGRRDVAADFLPSRPTTPRPVRAASPVSSTAGSIPPLGDPSTSSASADSKTGACDSAVTAERAKEDEQALAEPVTQAPRSQRGDGPISAADLIANAAAEGVTPRTTGGRHRRARRESSEDAIALQSEVPGSDPDLTETGRIEIPPYGDDENDDPQGRGK